MFPKGSHGRRFPPTVHPIRSRGTFCGSVAHADPASEWCLLAATLDAEFVMVGRRGRCKVRPSEYFVTPELQCSSLSRRSILRWLLPRMPSYPSADVRGKTAELREDEALQHRSLAIGEPHSLLSPRNGFP